MKEILLYNVISNDSFFGIGESGLIDRIAEEIKEANKEDILLRISSPGGSVFQGQAIITNLKEHQGKVNMIVDGMAASMAGVILAFADHVIADEYSMVMLHKAYGGDNAELLLAVNTNIANMFKAKRGIDSKIIDKIFLSKNTGDYWFTAQEAKDLGLIDEITSDGALSLVAKDENLIDKYYSFKGNVENKIINNNNEEEMDLLNKQEIKELENKLDTAQVDLEAKVNEVSNLSQENKDLKEANEKMTNEINEMNEAKKGEDAKAENVSLDVTAKFEALGKEVKDLADTNAKQITDMKQELSDLIAAIKKTNTDFEVEKVDNSKNIDSMAGFNEEINNQNKESK